MPEYLLFIAGNEPCTFKTLEEALAAKAKWGGRIFLSVELK